MAQHAQIRTKKSIAATLGTMNWIVLNNFFFAYFTQRKQNFAKADLLSVQVF